MSPFEIFRRNLKPLMVFLTALALFAFVVLPAMDSYMRRGGGGAVTDAELASFDGKPLKRSRVEYLTRNHQSTVRFLRELAEETIRRGGAPQTPGFAYDAQNRRIQSVGINEQPSELGTVRTIQFANEAMKSGFELDDTAIASWLYSFTDQGTVSENEMLAMLMQSTRNQMGKFHLYEMLRNQLLAGLYQQGNFSGLVINNQIPVVTPVEQWENFLKLNRQATARTYGVLVSDYLDQTNATPTEAEIQETYESGKDRFPNDQSPDPAFRRRETAEFEYVVADQLAFIEREKKNIAEEQLRAEYEKRLAGGEFQMPASADDILGFGDEDETDMADADTEAPDADADSDANLDVDEDQKDAKEVDDSGGDSEQDDAAADDTDQSSFARGPAVRLVALQGDDDGEQPSADSETDQPKEKKDKKSDGESGKEESGKDTNKKKKKAASDEDSETDSKDAKSDRKKESADKDSKSDVADKAESKKAKSEKDDPAKKASVEKDADQDESAKEPDGDKKMSEPESDGDESSKEMKSEDAGEEDQEEEPKVESFEEVRDQIASELAAPEARRKLTEGINDIDAKMRRYFNLKAIHESNLKIGRESEPPKKPDLKALADQYGMQLETIGPHDIVSLGNEPIAQSAELSGNVGQPGPPFTSMMFGVSGGQVETPKQQLFFPLKTADMTTGKVYVTWKTDEDEAYTPTLDEVRDEVIQAIRMEEAREIARLEAVRLADEANEGKDLATLIPEDKKSNLIEGLGPYSWMNSFGFGGAFLGNVPELDSVGEEFMAETFRTKPGQCGVAANLPERVIYVIEPTGFQPSQEELRRRFKQPRERMMALLIGVEDVQSIIDGFYQSIDERTGFNFVAPEQE